MTISKPEHIALSRAIQLLAALKAQYKIILPDGSEFGELKATPTRKRVAKYPRGTINNVFIDLVKAMKPGDLCSVPVGDVDIVTVRSSIAAWCTTNWGKGSAITSLNKERNAVEVLRVE